MTQLGERSTRADQKFIDGDSLLVYRQSGQNMLLGKKVQYAVQAEIEGCELKMHRALAKSWK